MKLRTKKIVTCTCILIATVIVLCAAWIKIQAQRDDQTVREDLVRVAKTIELYKTDTGAYPTGDDLMTLMGSASKYAIDIKDHGNVYLGGLSMDNNFFYCKQDNPSKYVLLAVENYDYAVYVTEGLQLHEYNLKGVTAGDRPTDYPFHVHNFAKTDICPTFLPAFTSSEDGYTHASGWESWTGIR